MFFPWPRWASMRRPKSGDRRPENRGNGRRKLGFDPLEERRLLAISITPSAITVNEGNAGPVNAVFTVQLDAPEAIAVTVLYNTSDGGGATGATAPGDYTPASGTLTFAAGSTAPQAITVQVQGDTIDEVDEVFNVALSGFTGTGGITGTNPAQVIINDDDSPAISINNLAAPEGNAGLTPFVFTATLSVASPQQITVDFTTSVSGGGTATPNVDFNTTSGVITFAPGITSRPVTVNVIGDTQQETNETFFVDLSNSVDGTIATPRATGTIIDDEVPLLSIADNSIFEGDDLGFGSFRDMIFTVTMSAPSVQTVTVQFATADGPASFTNTQPNHATFIADYNATSGVLTFQPGETVKNITVQIKGENVHERDELFLVNINNPTNANILDGQANGRILNDDQIPQVTILDAVIVETNPTTLPAPDDRSQLLQLQFVLSNPSSGTIVVTYNYQDETATGGGIGRATTETNHLVDYRRTWPVPNFPGDTIMNPNPDPPFEVGVAPFTTPNTITIIAQTSFGLGAVRIFRDTIPESNETFAVKGALITPGTAPAQLVKDTGRVTILDDDARPGLFVANPSTVVEGDVGQNRFLVFTVEMASPSPFGDSEQNVTVDFAVVPTGANPATPGVDYVDLTGTLLFDRRIAGTPPTNGVVARSISIPIIGDFIDEQNETLNLVLTNAVNSGILTPTTLGTIIDDDGPALNVNDVTVVEGNSGTTNAVFTVTLSATTVQTVVVDFFTANGSAIAGPDYVNTSGKLTFTPGSTQRQVTVPVVGDTLFEQTEFFLLNLQNPVGASINRNTGIGTILNDDIVPGISIADATVFEGDSGSTNMLFTVSLTAASNQNVGVNFQTFSGSALGGVDYANLSSNLVFAPGEVTKQITIQVFGDTTVEPDENFFIILSGPINGSIDDGTAEGTILDDDAPPRVTIDDVVVIEGAAGDPTPAVFAVRLSKTSLVPVTVTFVTADGGATAPADYAVTSGTLSFSPGETTHQVTVLVADDMAMEGIEDFFVNLTNATQATLLDNQGVGTIVDNDTPFLSIGDVTVLEGNTGSVNAVFLVTMSRMEGVDVTVEFATANGTTNPALAGADYMATSGTLTILAGETTGMITVSVTSDTVDERDETFFVNLTNPMGAMASIFDGQGVGTIDDDDGPTISIADRAVQEFNAGLVFADFVVTLSSTSVQTVTVAFVTSDGVVNPATGGGVDYFGTSGTLTFAPGQLTQTIRVNVLGDTIDELDETYFVTLSNPVDATFADNIALGTIVDDDAPGISINDVTVLEGDSGLIFANFPVLLNAPSVQSFTVVVTTQDNSALANFDYFPTQVTLTFTPAGPTLINVPVQIVPDMLTEPDESFFVNLSSPTAGASIIDPQAIGTITDDDTRLFINDISVNEGNSGTQTASFSVTMTQARAANVTVEFVTVNGTALSGLDYNALSGTLTFFPGETSKLLTVQVRGDTIDEPDENFFVSLSNPVNAFPGDMLGQATIVDNDPPPAISVAGVTVVEGNAGTTSAVFNVTLSAESGFNVSFVFATADGTAMAPGQYQAASGTLTFSPGQTSMPVTVLVQTDTVTEPNQDFTLTLSSPVNATLGTATATGVIIDDDPTISINNISVVETSAGTTNAVFTVTLSKPASAVVTADFNAVNGTALAILDFSPASGSIQFNPNTLTFALGETAKNITVQVIGDTLDELDETFQLNVMNIVGATPASISGTATIIDDDPPPALSIDSVTVTEGDAGTTNAVFTVSLSAVSGKQITVVYATAMDTGPNPATAGSDYTAVSGTLTFAPGTASQVVVVPVLGDFDVEASETFLVNLSAGVNATLGLSVGVGTIIDDEPRVSVSDVTVTELDAGQQVPAVFNISLTRPAISPITVNFNTEVLAGTAFAPGDYTATSGSVVFMAGQQQLPVTVMVQGDLLDEDNEVFHLSLTGVSSNSAIMDAVGDGTIIDNDPVPFITINDIALAEGDAGLTNFVFTVSMSPASGRQVTVAFTTANGLGPNGAISPSDYTSSAGTLTFAAGETVKNITVRVNGDTNVEQDETFFVNLSSPVNVTLSDSQGVGTIVNDEPMLTINDISVTEGDSGLVNAVFNVTLSRTTPTTVTVVFTTANGTATAGAAGDYTATTGTLSFNSGTTARTITVAVRSDLLDEDDETFFVNLSNSVGASILDNQGVGTIVDNDPLPSLTITDVSAVEGNTGTTNFVFSVALAPVSGRNVTVAFATQDVSTTAGADYTPTSGILTFTPGTTSQQVTVSVAADTLGEPDETFLVQLSGAVNAALVKSQGIGQILDDEPRLAINSVSVTEGNFGPMNAVFTVTLTGTASGVVTVPFATSDNTAVNPADYTPNSGTLTFNVGQTAQTITVQVAGDSADEDDETFFVNLLAPSTNAVVQTGIGTGTIVDNDPPPTLSILDASVLEGNSGTADAVFTVQLTPASGRTVTVAFSTSAGLGPNGAGVADFNAAGGTLTFLPGQTTQQLTVQAVGDTLGEQNETFNVNLSAAVNASIGDGVADGVIIDDEPRVSVNDISVTETNVNIDAVFTVSLSTVGSGDVVVIVQTAAGTAVAPADFLATAQTLTFSAGQTTQDVTVSVVGDNIKEDPETFTLNILSVSNNAVVLDAQGVATIDNDDTDPGVSINGVSTFEGDAGNTSFVFNVDLTSPSGQQVAVGFATANGTATAGSDYTAASGSITFAPGVTRMPITVSVLGDQTPENNEQFSVNLTGALNGVLVDPTTATGLIIDEDPFITINDQTLVEGNTSGPNAIFTVTLSKPTNDTVTAGFFTQNNTALWVFDYVPVSGTLTFAAGETQKNITVPIVADTIDEPVETFFLILSPLNGATASSKTLGLGFILNDDFSPDMSIGDVTVTEGNFGTSNASFPVTLSAPSGQIVTVAFVTGDGTAVAPADYQATSGTITFQPGETIKQIVVPVVGETVIESNEGFTVTLSNATNAVLVDNLGIATILDNEQSGFIVTGAGIGGGPHVQAFQDVSGQLKISIFAYSPAYTGSVRVASGDVNGDGQPDLITVPGTGGGPHVRIFDGKNGANIGNVFAFDGVYSGGLSVAVGDVTGDGRADIFLGADSASGLGRAQVINGATLAVIRNFDLNPAAFGGGVRVAAGDVNGDGRADLIAGAGPGNTPRVVALDVLSGATLLDFFAYAPAFGAGIFVAAGDMNGDGRADIITGPDAGGGPHVRVFNSAAAGVELFGYFAYAGGFTGGVRVGVTDFNSDGRADIITAPGAGGGPHVIVRSGADLSTLASFFAYTPGFTGGVYVGGSFQGPGSPLRLAGGATAHEADAQQVSQDELAPLVEAAIRAWAFSTGDASVADRLRNIEVRVTDLPADYLGMAYASTIYIDRDAAGRGWFVDSTPDANEEFGLATGDGLLATDAAAADGVDLLSVIAHELGHTLGLDDLEGDHDDDVMGAFLGTGIRRTVGAEAVDAVFQSGEWE